MKGLRYSPVPFTTSFLLDLLGVLVDEAALGKEAREMLLRLSSAVGDAGVVTISEFMGASHWGALSVVSTID